MLSLCVCVCVCVRFEKAAQEYQDLLSAVTGMDCSVKSCDRSLLKLSGASNSTAASPKHTGNGESHTHTPKPTLKDSRKTGCV